VDESGTVFVRTADGEREVGSYPGASHAEALGYFTRKYDELLASAELLLQRVTHTDLPAREGSEGLAKLLEQTTDARVVGDLDALDARVAQIAAAVQAKKATEAAERSAAREAGRAKREELVLEAERIAAQPEAKIQWKTSGTQRRSKFFRQGPAGPLRPARRHSGRGQVSQGEAGERGRGARTEQGLGTDRDGVQTADGPLARSRSRLPL